LRRTSINNFGFGGSNAHIILEEAPDIPLSPSIAKLTTDVPKSQNPTAKLFVLFAKDKSSLESNALALADWISRVADGGDGLHDLSYTLCCRRTQFPYRFATYAQTKEQLAEALRGNLRIGRVSDTNKTAFLFSGQSAQWAQMGMSLMRYSVFANALSEAQDCLTKLGVKWLLLGTWTWRP
jgi:acyl transferase domain-containing protein